MAWHLISVDAGAFLVGQPCGGEKSLNHRILTLPIVVDVRGDRYDLLLDRTVFRAQPGLEAQHIPDTQWLRSDKDPVTTTYVLVPPNRSGCLNAHRCGIPNSPSG